MNKQNMEKNGVAMFSRKVIQLGNGLSLRLPVSWIRARRITKGDRLALYIAADGNLVIEPLEVS